MKILIAISIGILAFNGYGQVKFSVNGLEGWGKKQGVKIIVEDYSKKDKTFDIKAIKNQVELKLRLAGIKIGDKDLFDNIHITLQPIHVGDRLTGYYLIITPIRNMTFVYNGIKYIVFIGRTTHYGGVSPPNYRKFMEQQLDELLLDYLKANPKKDKEDNKE